MSLLRPQHRLRAALAALERRRHSVGAIAVVIVLALCGFALQRLLAEMRLADVSNAIASLPIRAPLASLMLTCGSFLVLVGYDWSALRYVGRRLPLHIVALGSFCGYAIGNTVGFALLSGGSVRFRIYSAAGLASEDVGRVALFCVTAFGFGICAISGLGVLIRPSLLAHILAVPVALLQAVSVALILAIGTFLVMCWQRRTIRWRGLSLPLPSVSLAAGQLAISALDVCLAGAALWVLLPHQLGFSYLAFLPLYCVAIVAGVMSHVPGGLGVFEAVILFALDDHSEASLLVGALVIYRLIYYVLPLVAAGVFLGLNELRLLIPATSGTMRRVIDLTSAMVPTVASVLIVFAATVLFASGATPMLPERAAVLSAILPLPLVEAAHFLAGLTATALLLLAPALQRRLNGAYWLAQAALVAGIGCSLAKGLDYEEATALAAIAMILVPYRREFYRPTSLLDQPFTVGWMIAIIGILGATLWLMLFAYAHVEYDHSLWFQFAFEADAPRSLRAMLASVLLIVGVAVFRLLGRPRPAASAATDTEISLAEDISRSQQRADALLVLMRDKRLLFSTSGRSFLMFGEHGGSRIALFDPFGEEADYPELVWQFRELCDRQRVRAAFYQVRPDHLPLYIDAGLTLTKLGEEARVPLQDFDLKDARHAKLRYALSRGGRDGLRFRMLPRDEVPGASSRLAAVSKAWLAMKSVSEKRFSLGAFTPAYVANFDVATVLLREEIVAFATLLRTDAGTEATIDIMRHQADAPGLSMEFLVVSLILELKACGLEWFNLGMAPLSGLDRHRLAPLAHRLGAIVYEHGEQFYGFRGLRQFKEKFDPRWEPRYLASPGGMDPLIVLADVAALIGGGSLIDVVRK